MLKIERMLDIAIECGIPMGEPDGNHYIMDADGNEKILTYRDECEYCKPNSFNILIKSEKIGSLIYWIASKAEKVTNQDISDCEYENSVVFEIRNGRGYIRLGDTSEMGCIDHSENFEVKNCPMCGRRLGE